MIVDHGYPRVKFNSSPLKNDGTGRFRSKPFLLGETVVTLQGDKLAGFNFGKGRGIEFQVIFGQEKMMAAAVLKWKR